MLEILTDHLFKKHNPKPAKAGDTPPPENQPTPEQGTPPEAQEKPPMPEAGALPATVVEIDDKAIAPLTTIKTEANFAQLPFFALSRKDAAKKTETEYRVVVERDGQKLEALWEVSANTKYGYPGPFDRKVHKAFEYLITERGTPVQNPIPFTSYQICKLIGVNTSGRSKKRVMGAVERIVTTSVKSQGTFYDKSKKRYITDVFHLYDRVVLKGEEDRATGQIAEKNLLYLSTWYLDSLNAHYVRPIDFQYLKSLESDVAGRLYELLGLKFYGVLSNQRAYWRVGYSELCLLLPITPQRYFSNAQLNLKSAHDELVKTGFLQSVEWEREKKALWFIRYYPGERARAEFGPTQQELEGAEQLNLPIAEQPKPPRSRHGSRRDRGLNAKFEAQAEAKRPRTAQEQGLIEKLTSYGIAANQVTGPAELLRDYGAEEVEKRVLALDHMTKQGKPPLSPQLIIASLQQGWIPNAYAEAVAEQEKAEARRQREQALTDEYRRQAEAIKAQVTEWASLPPDKRISFARLDLWIVNFRRRYGRNPDPEEHQAHLAQMIASLPTPEERLEHELRDLQADFDRTAREQGISFKP
jgi:hypothetical protein